MDKDNIKKLTVYVPAALIVIILALLPFHAFLTVWGSSVVGHYTALRLWKEYLLVIILIGAITTFFTDKKVRQLFYNSRLIQLILLFLVIEFIWGVVSYQQKAVSTKALFYGWLSDSRYLIFFVATLIIAKKTSLLKNKSIKLVIWPAVIVILFGLLEVFVLPNNFLSHFGYGPNTIKPYETVNNNIQYLRIISTLRGSNPLGAYLIIPLSLGSVLLIKGKKVWPMIIFLIAGLIVMIFSYSRSAWLGLAVAVALAVYFGLKSAKIKRALLYSAVGIVIILSGVYVAYRHNPNIQNIIFHYQTHSASPTSSDQLHLKAITTDFKNIAKKPLGYGVGTVGPASVYNTRRPSYIPENYYAQIGLETGWLGLVAFLAVNVLVALSLWVRRDNTLALALLASFIGLFVCNLVLEAWTDDTLCYIWWGLAAIVIASNSLPTKFKKNKWVT